MGGVREQRRVGSPLYDAVLRDIFFSPFWQVGASLSDATHLSRGVLTRGYTGVNGLTGNESRKLVMQPFLRFAFAARI